MLRAIHIFPKFSNVQLIENFRSNYDPLFNLVEPHVTLVFPFESQISLDVLENHIRNSVMGSTPFDMVLKGITGSENEYLFLNVKEGNDQIIKLHDQLYSGILKPFLNRQHTYIPHMTIGRFHHQEDLHTALNETENFNDFFRTEVHEITVERIAESGQSIIELRIPLHVM